MTTEPELSIAPSDMCFGCGRNNPCGVRLRFHWDGKAAKSEFTPTELHQGWKDIIHGGILTTLLDEAMAYAAYFENVAGVTGTMEVKFRRPVSIGQHLKITAWIAKRERRFAETRAQLTLSDGTVVTEAKATQYIISKKGCDF
ncbi:MAG: PaaI family thioesterase [Dehalococcoidales bacterium]|nr:PaaI family thioesterase [Dehalococcoidales bacterium]